MISQLSPVAVGARPAAVVATVALAACAPRNHIPLTEDPLDHTSWFRRDRAEFAERSATRRAARPAQMSGNPASRIALPTRRKATCEPCHDGATAFKVTGRTCTRRHPEATKGVAR